MLMIFRASATEGSSTRDAGPTARITLQGFFRGSVNGGRLVGTLGRRASDRSGEVVRPARWVSAPDEQARRSRTARVGGKGRGRSGGAPYVLIAVAALVLAACDRTPQPGDRVRSKIYGAGSIGDSAEPVRLTLHEYHPPRAERITGRHIVFSVPEHFTTMTSSQSDGPKLAIYLGFALDERLSLSPLLGKDRRTVDSVSVSLRDGGSAPIEGSEVAPDLFSFPSAASSPFRATGRDRCGFKEYAEVDERAIGQPVRTVGGITLYTRADGVEPYRLKVSCRLGTQPSHCSTGRPYSIFGMKVTFSEANLCRADEIISVVRSKIDSFVVETHHLPPQHP
jgi:hypothetical protein